MDDVELVIVAITNLGAIKPSTDSAWSRHSALKVIDCVLSLNRNYDKFVVPRLEKFALTHPSVLQVQDLDAAIAAFPSPAAFVKETLNYKDPARAAMLSAVVNYLLKEAKRMAKGSEEDALRQWAEDMHPQDYLTIGICGFGLAGFQYLRMLFGADTTKPDVHICRFVGKALNRPVTELAALQILEQAALRLKIKVRDLDTTIWEKSVRQ
jgi:hypothetical protein